MVDGSRGQGTEDTGQGEFGIKNGATGRSDIEGKAAREAASEWGRERVSMERHGTRRDRESRG